MTCRDTRLVTDSYVELSCTDFDTAPSSPLVFCIGVTDIGLQYVLMGGEMMKCSSPSAVRTLRHHEHKMGQHRHVWGLTSRKKSANLSVTAIHSVRRVVKRTSEILGSR